MHREYDPALIGVLQNETYLIQEDGLDITVKPVPDDARRHVLDPRVLANASKPAGAAAPSPSWTSLLGVRRRTLKADCELASTEVAFDEFLIEAGDHKIDLYSWSPARRSDSSPVLLYLHGGAFAAGDVTQYRRALAFVAEQSGALVLFPEYRLAPEAPFPCAIEDCAAAVRYVLDHASELGVDPSRLVIAGDSAGGSLANACIQMFPQGTFAHAIELYPETFLLADDPEWSWDAYPVIAEQAEVARGRVERLKGALEVVDEMYVQGKTGLDDPLVSACCAAPDVLAAFPPTTVVTAEYDYLRVQGERFARQLQTAGVPVQTIRYAGCDHGFFEWPGVRPQTEDLVLVIAGIISDLA